MGRSVPGGKECAGGEGVGRGERGGPGRKESAGGKGVGRGGRSGPGGEGVGRGGLSCCTLYIPTSKIFYSIF